MRARDLEKITGGKLLGDKKVYANSFSIDTRTLKEGQVFVALRGSRFDGNDFLEEAFSKGAVGVIGRRPPKTVPKGKFALVVNDPLDALRRIARFKRENFKGTVIGVVGSAGKTTTKDLIHFLLSGVYRTYKSEGNLNSQIGLPLVLANMPQNPEVAVFEMGASQLGDVEKLRALVQPSVRVLTALGEEHLQTFGSLENVIKGNGEIFNEMQEDHVAVLPRYALDYYSLKGKVFTFGDGGKIKADRVSISLEGLDITVDGETYRIPSLNLGLVDSLCASFCVLKAFGLEPRDFKGRLLEFRPPPGRMNLIRFEDFTLVDDSYNSNPLSLKNALKTLSAIDCAGKKVLVMGDMLELGEKEEELHSKAGKWIKEAGIDYGLFYGKLSKFAFEEFKRSGGRGMWVENKEDLLKEVLKWTKDKNIILVKGSRGMRLDSLVKRVEELKLHEKT